MNRIDVINYLIKKFNYETYLEIGVATGECFNKIIIKNKESVDPAEGQYSVAKPTYKMTSDEFFKQNIKKFDIIFIDGLHHTDQVDKDIEHSLMYLNDNGTIILHDVIPMSEIAQRVPRETSGWNGDVWKSIVKYRSKNNDLGCITLNLLPYEQGISIIKKSIHDTFILNLPDILTYDWLLNNFKDALGIVENPTNFLNNLS